MRAIKAAFPGIGISCDSESNRGSTLCDDCGGQKQVPAVQAAGTALLFGLVLTTGIM